MSAKEREAKLSGPQQECFPLPQSSRGKDGDVMVLAEPPPANPPLESFFWTASTLPHPSVGQNGVPQGFVPPPPKKKSLLEAYILGLPLGFLGAHHFYLGRHAFGVLYLFSFGLLGCGWVLDLLRMPCLVRKVNQANRDKHQQLQTLQQQLAQQQQQQGAGPQQTGSTQNVIFLPFEPKYLDDAYVLWFPCGLFGFHHFYLRNYGMGFLYLFTVGLLGIGWLVDLVLMRSWVREANKKASAATQRRYDQCKAHILALSPAGLLGAHYYYLGKPIWGLLYTLTLGLGGTGWVRDWLRTNFLVRRANRTLQGLASPNQKYLDDAYMLCFPFGFLGLHHFYLGRISWGFLYLFTVGLLGIGWLVDFIRLPCLVRDYNNSLDNSDRRLLGNNKTASSSSDRLSSHDTGTGSWSHVQNEAGEGHVTVVVSPAVPSVYPGYQQGGEGQGLYPTLASSGSYPGGAAAPSGVVVEGGGVVMMTQPPQYNATAPTDPTTVIVLQDGSPPSYDESQGVQKQMENKTKH